MSISTIITTLLAIIATGATVFSVIKSYRKKELLVSRIYSASTNDFDLSRVGDLKVSYSSRIFDNISSEEFLLFNNGTESIDGEDVITESPIVFYSNSNTEILDSKIRSESNKQINADLVKIDRNSVLLRFQWLFKKSGIRIRLIFSGDDPQIGIKGRIKKYPPLNKIDYVRFKSLYSEVSHRFRIMGSFLDGLIVASIITPVFVIIIALISLAVNFFRSAEEKAYIFTPPAIVAQYKEIQRELLIRGC